MLILYTGSSMFCCVFYCNQSCLLVVSLDAHKYFEETNLCKKLTIQMTHCTKLEVKVQPHCS